MQNIISIYRRLYNNNELDLFAYLSQLKYAIEIE